MPRLTATLIIKTTYDVTNTSLSADVVARSEEDKIRDDLVGSAAKLIGFAKQKGTITWTVKPAKEGE
jgi:hypothetical protein